VITRAAELGIETVDFEADSTDHAAWTMLSTFASLGDICYATWQFPL
jgi:hypothetical protein